MSIEVFSLKFKNCLDSWLQATKKALSPAYAQRCHWWMLQVLVAGEGLGVQKNLAENIIALSTRHRMSAQMAEDGGPHALAAKFPHQWSIRPRQYYHVKVEPAHQCSSFWVRLERHSGCIRRTTTTTDSDPSTVSLRPLRWQVSRLLVSPDPLVLID